MIFAEMVGFLGCWCRFTFRAMICCRVLKFDFYGGRFAC